MVDRPRNADRWLSLKRLISELRSTLKMEFESQRTQLIIELDQTCGTIGISLLLCI